MHFAKGRMDDKQRLYYDALRALAIGHDIYRKNLVTFTNADERWRNRFIAHIERQSEAGLPFAVELVQAVTLLRLKA
jgi:hypothetical protein